MRLRRAVRMTVLVFLLGSFSSPFASQGRKDVADTVILHANIYTLDPDRAWAEAIAIQGSTILAVGDGKTIERYRGPRTRVIDANGRLILPGFADCHIHFLEGSLSLLNVTLDGSKSIREIQQRVRDFVLRHRQRKWILGRGWVYSLFGDAALPHKKYLDEVVPDRPVFLEGYDGHTYWANSKALELAGITSKTPNPPNGVIVRDPVTAEPTGALKERAAALVERVVPKYTRAEKLKALRLGLAEANRAGLVRVHSAGGDFEAADLYDELRRTGQLTVRMYIAAFLNPPRLRPSFIEKIEKARKRHGGDWIACGAVKMMLDGVVESHTAAMLSPYADDSNQLGKMFWEPFDYKKAVRELDGSGLQIFTHAIGEAAVRLALDAYEEARQANGTAGAHHRVEHIETITSQDIPRFGTLGVIASFQPLHAYPDANLLTVWARNAGTERVGRAFAWQSVLGAGGTLAFGSDWPVVTLNPWVGIQNAVTREDDTGHPRGGWAPQQRISLAQAIEAYTRGAAIAGRREKWEGSLEPGKFADLIMVNQNLFEIDPHVIGKTEVVLTMVGGKTVYLRDAGHTAGQAQRTVAP